MIHFLLLWHDIVCLCWKCRKTATNWLTSFCIVLFYIQFRLSVSAVSTAVNVMLRFNCWSNFRRYHEFYVLDQKLQEFHGNHPIGYFRTSNHRYVIFFWVCFLLLRRKWITMAQWSRQWFQSHCELRIWCGCQELDVAFLGSNPAEKSRAPNLRAARKSHTGGCKQRTTLTVTICFIVLSYLLTYLLK